MTPSALSVPLSVKLCRNRLHFYDCTIRTCPFCKGATGRAHYLKNRDKQLAAEKVKRDLNRDFYIAKSRAYWHVNKEEIKRRSKERYLANPEARRRQAREWAEKNRERCVWKAMVSRCSNPRDGAYLNYGGRGIRICPRWFGVGGFENFLADMGRRPSSAHSLERLDNNGNYELGNVVWSTRKQQARNRRSNRLLTISGKTQCLQAWAEEMGLPYQRIRDRIERLGWSAEEAISTAPLESGSGRRVS